MAGDEFLIDGNEAVEFKLIRKPEDILDDSIGFHPLMCHQIFGDKELIYGFKDLKVKLYYTSAWMYIYWEVEYSDKADDAEPKDLLKKVTTKYGFPLIENIGPFESKIEENKCFKPYGELITHFSIIDEKERETSYEIYHCCVDVPRFGQFLRRLQTLILWFVDAASFIDFDDRLWNVFTVYEKYKNEEGNMVYAVVGFATVYEYYAYPCMIRPRISQVLILPPFQSRGICAKLLTSIYSFYSSTEKVLDFTVEDPSEDFQRVRDYVDCQRVEESKTIPPEELKKGFTKDVLEKLHSQHKLNKRQAIRVFEILRLKSIDMSNEEEFRKYRLDVKRRLNQPFQRQKKIFDKCSQGMTPQEIQESFLDDDERKEKLEVMFLELLDQYKPVMNRLSAV